MTGDSRSKAHSVPEQKDGLALAPGDLIGRYQLTSLLASGGMGQVWTARPVGTGFARTVALKLMRPEMSSDENYARMFIDEATVASSIHHPNVCETYELGKHGDRLYMAMEWVAGDSLAGLLRQGDTLVALDPRIAARIIADACAGLHAAHETVGPDGTLLGVVHRDISPPNILVSAQGQSKVSDFGIAKARHQLHERTKTGEVKGKFAYIPPEQLSGGAVDRRADIYAMGCVLYVATLGVRPFGNGADALRKILLNEYRPPRSLRPDYPEGLEAIIVKALAPTPDARFQTAEEMQIALEEWLVSSGKLVTASDVAKCVKERMSPDVRARNEALLSQNRVAPALLMNRLAADYDSETPTAGSGLVTAPPGLWVGPGKAKDDARAPTPAATELGAAMDDPTEPGHEIEPSESMPVTKAASAVARSSDATELMDFVPGAEAKPPAEQKLAVTAETAPSKPQRTLPIALVLLAVVLLVLWLSSSR